MKNMNYARSIRLLRAALGVSQQELASMTGLPESSILSHVEAGRRPLPEKTKKAIARALGVPLSLFDLFAMEPNNKHTEEEIVEIGKAIVKLSKIAHEKKN